LLFPKQALLRWGVSSDEVMATAKHNVAGPPDVEVEPLVCDGAEIQMTLGHRWISSLIVDGVTLPTGPQGSIVGIPRFDVCSGG
jgi:hypothetical protein